MTVLTSTEAFLGINYPQKNTAASTVRSYLYPGSLQTSSTSPVVLTSTMAFLGINYPQKNTSASTVRDYLFPGALQPNSTSTSTGGVSFLAAWALNKEIVVTGYSF